MAVLKLNEANFSEVTGKGTVLVDFYADWCGPCRMMAPVIGKMAEEFEGRIKVGKCNVDDNMDIAEQYRITSIPAFKVFKNGSVAAEFIGAMSAADLKDKLEKRLGRTIRLECAIDPSLLGGLLVQVDGRVIDGSLKHRLHEIKEVMNR